VAFTDFRRELDFREGELRREFVWHTATGKRLRVAFGRFLSMRTKELAAQRITLTPLNFTGDVTVTLGMDFSVVHEAYRRGYWSCPKQSGVDNHTALLGVSRTIGQQVYADFRVTATVPVRTVHLVGEY
jgi:maltose phosphorylase